MLTVQSRNLIMRLGPLLVAISMLETFGIESE